MATHSNILAWRIPWTEQPSPKRVEKSWTWLKRLSTRARMHTQRHLWWSHLAHEKGSWTSSSEWWPGMPLSSPQGPESPPGTKNNLASNINDVTRPRIVPTPFCHDWHAEEAGTVVLQHAPLSGFVSCCLMSFSLFLYASYFLQTGCWVERFDQSQV